MLGFICEPCKTAGDIPTDNNAGMILILKRTHHNQCKGSTWCDCQHRIGKKNI